MLRRSILVALPALCFACGPRPAPQPVGTAPPVSAAASPAPTAAITTPVAAPTAPDSAAAALPVAATLDTLRATGRRPAVPGDVRDPRTEPLFVRYASPAEAMRLLTGSPFFDPDKLRWRYAPPDSVSKGK
ncbi:MAG: hypothetical protein U0167_17940 [bacterium]